MAYRMKLRLLILFGWLAFCFLFLILIKLLRAGSIEKFYFYWDAVGWNYLDCLIGAGLVILVKKTFHLFSENSASVKRDFLILIATIPPIAFILTLDRILILETLIFPKPHNLWNWVTEYLVFFITQTIVCFSCISYFYISTLIKTQARLLEAQQAESEMQLKILQQKVDPHFLFNNLNVLSSLVRKNPETASEFLNRFAELYRYILQTQNSEVVPLKDELVFAENYAYLLKQRFGRAYSFDWQVPPDKINGQMIIPSALQNSLENVVKHNAGDQHQPLQIKIRLNKDFLSVENELRAKSQTRPTSGTGLQNLTKRYTLLTETPVEVLNDEKTFKVKLPLLRLKK